ncbi:DUF3991 and TOPRIM domain-containing protein [Paenibacillus camerounensis]|uniref:DUF3991 and TOPRIM domain-containing protein n=1 Tax=Paenibacillus camerounensis TaxID=1243663 RepID=UPI000A78CAC3|nr:DUF3991 and TOPRIM domain-containing protein [Paenibacillus camerounensis]
MDTKKYFSKEQIELANRVNLIEFANSHGYILENGGHRALHAKQSGGLYFFREGNKYYHFSTDTHGGPIDFVMQFWNMNFKEAVSYLLENKLPEYNSLSHVVKERGKLALPDKAPNFRRVEWYLIHIRGIDLQIVTFLMHEKKLYQQNKTGNCVFVGYDENQNPRYCSLRGCSPERPFKQDREYSDKSYPFHIAGTSQLIYVCESPIDAMSHATLVKLAGRDWRDDHRISLGCLSDQALERFLNQYPDINEIIFCLDNDQNATFQDGSPAPNWGQQAAFKFAEKYADLGYTTSVESPHGKDINEDLHAQRYIIARKKYWIEEENNLEL